MKAGWKTVKLGDVADITSGLWKGELGELIEAKVYRATNFIGNGELSDDKLVSIPVELKKLTKRTLEPGDILLEKSGGGPNQPVGRVGFFDKSEPLHSFSNFTSRLRVRKGSSLDPKFLHKYLFWTHLRGDTASMQNNSTNIRNLDLDKYREIEIPLPPLAEQKRIVALLDEAFAGIDEAKLNTEASLQGAKSAYESYSDSIFSAQRPDWSVMRLGELCEFLNGFAFKSGDVVKKSQTQLVRMGNLYGNELDLNRSPVFYPNSFAKDYARYVLAEGDVIMSLTGTTGKRDYGFAVRIPSCQHALLLNQRIMKFGSIRQDSVDDTYFLHYLRSRCFLDILYPTAKGTRQANLSSVTMKSLPVPIPPLKEQETISEKISDMRAETIRLSDLLTIKLGKLSELKSSLLAQAFAGELTA